MAFNHLFPILSNYICQHSVTHIREFQWQFYAKHRILRVKKYCTLNYVMYYIYYWGLKITQIQFTLYLKKYKIQENLLLEDDRCWKTVIEYMVVRMMAVDRLINQNELNLTRNLIYISNFKINGFITKYLNYGYLQKCA